MKLKVYRLTVMGAPKRYIIDMKFAKKVARYNWRYSERRHRARATIIKGKPRLLLHQYICRLAGYKWVEIFFANQDLFDCRLANLQPYRRTEEGARRKTFKGKKVRYRGVFLKKQTGKFGAAIRHRGKLIHLGYFNTPELAAEAYRKAYALAHPNMPIPVI